MIKFRISVNFMLLKIFYYEKQDFAYHKYALRIDVY
ncbi:hypothetical protein DSM04_10421 [Leeuwenhoekiella aestuarii]|uniref:Uncharacterized protein n=1 Tax=Leeuwenhoekiella aestuarii TaxID=2249426 RepID=A0A4V1KP57_9FLAO|nr:hypothetical protein DSM04_10421 [Leeuwenhoekiella aestuarii]